MTATEIERAEAVKEAAREQGFDACGIARADSIDPADRLGTWLDRGYHAEMDWMARTKAERQNVEKKLAGTRSVVVVARNYNSARPDAPAGSGRVARYAWGRDYHNALKKPLRQVARLIEKFEAGAQTYCCIDTGPVLEKAWAARAGLGWIGKNSLVLRRGLGSYFFLGTILTTVELAADPPVPDQCGTCRLCIDACPTDAIVAPQIVDSQRCISYHTIENRGEIPEALHKHFDNWVFGCDICQEVCPWNRRAPETTLADFRPRTGHANPDLGWLQEMTEEAFRQEFTGTPILRSKHAGMRRNAQIAVQNRPVS